MAYITEHPPTHTNLMYSHAEKNPISISHFSTLFLSVSKHVFEHVSVRLCASSHRMLHRWASAYLCATTALLMKINLIPRNRFRSGKQPRRQRIVRMQCAAPTAQSEAMPEVDVLRMLKPDFHLMKRLLLPYKYLI